MASYLGKRPLDLLDVEVDEITPLLATVVAAGAERYAVVSGPTRGDQGAWWSCRHRPAHYVADGTLINVVVATV